MQATKPDGTIVTKRSQEITYRMRETTRYLKNRVEDGLIISQGAAPSALVGISAGRAIANNVWFDVAAASLDTPSCAASARRIDLVLLTPSAGFTILQGAAAASPASPEPSVGLGVVLAKLRRGLNGGGTTANVMVNADIKNEARHRFLRILENTG